MSHPFVEVKCHHHCGFLERLKFVWPEILATQIQGICIKFEHCIEIGTLNPVYMNVLLIAKINQNYT